MGGHVIEVFSSGCPLCRETIEMVEFGKCRDCKMIIHDVVNPSQETREKMRMYNVNAVPTIVIDGVIKVVGVPDFPWICGDEFYKMLRERFPLK